MDEDYKIVSAKKILLRNQNNLELDKLISQKRDVIEEIWLKTLKDREDVIFNGSLPNFIELKNTKEGLEITCNFIEYKTFLAQRIRPELNLGIKPVAVSGIIIIEDYNERHTIFAKRAKSTTEYPEYLELAPSGSIDKECKRKDGNIDYKAKLLEEFEEETGLSRNYVKRIEEFVFVLDQKDNVYDIGCQIIIQESKELITREFSSTEYESPIFVELKDLNSFINTNKKLIVPTSLALIEALNQLK